MSQRLLGIEALSAGGVQNKLAGGIGGIGGLLGMIEPTSDLITNLVLSSSVTGWAGSKQLLPAMDQASVTTSDVATAGVPGCVGALSSALKMLDSVSSVGSLQPSSPTLDLLYGRSGTAGALDDMRVSSQIGYINDAAWFTPLLDDLAGLVQVPSAMDLMTGYRGIDTLGVATEMADVIGRAKVFGLSSVVEELVTSARGPLPRDAALTPSSVLLAGSRLRDELRDRVDEQALCQVAAEDAAAGTTEGSPKHRSRLVRILAVRLSDLIQERSEDQWHEQQKRALQRSAFVLVSGFIALIHMSGESNPALGALLEQFTLLGMAPDAVGGGALAHHTLGVVYDRAHGRDS